MILSVNCRALLVIATWVLSLYSSIVTVYLVSIQIVNSEFDTCSAILPQGLTAALKKQMLL